MREIASSITVEIERGETVPLVVAHSTRLTIKGAPVWLTRSNDVEDYYLLPGQALMLRRGERLWIGTEGAEPARVSFVAPVPRRDFARQWLADLLERFALRWRTGWRTV